MKPSSPIVVLFLFVYLFVFLVRCIEASLPYDHSDALYYHLAGARIWYERSFHELIINLPSYAQAGIFDYFYYPLFFFKLGLVKTHSLAQFLHFLFSLGLASLFCFITARKSFWGILAALSFLTISKDGSYFLYAKNDGVLALIGLLATYLVVEKKDWKLVGLFLGLLPLVKLSGLYVVVPVSLLYVYLNRNPKDILKVALMSGAMLLLALGKNYAISGNPFFPGMGSYFPGISSPSMLEYSSGFFGHGVTLTTLKGLLSDLFLGKVLLLLSLPLFILNWKKKVKLNNYYFLVAVCIFLIYLFSNGGYQAARFFFTCHFLLIYFIFKSLREYKLSTKWAFCIFLLILADAKIDKSIKRASNAVKDFATLSDDQIKLLRIPHTAFWQKLPETNTAIYIISDYVAESYYLPNKYILHIPDHSPQADFLYHCEGERLTELKRYQFALISRNISNACYQEIKKGTLLLRKDGLELYQLL